MKWILPLVVGAMVLCGCEPSVRYSSAPPKPVADHRVTHTEPEPSDSRRDVSPVDVALMQRIVDGYIGVPYRSGGFGRLGVDCSGLVYAVYRDYDGLHLPPNTRKLFDQLSRVSYRNLECGDLVFFSLGGEYVSHVGIYVGDGRFVHASRSQGVMVSAMSEDYYRNSYVGARRVLR